MQVKVKIHESLDDVIRIEDGIRIKHDSDLIGRVIKDEARGSLRIEYNDSEASNEVIYNVAYIAYIKHYFHGKSLKKFNFNYRNKKYKTRIDNDTITILD